MILPNSLRELLENKGIEGDDLSHIGTTLYVDCPDFEGAAQLREQILDGEEFNCRLISNPDTGKPVVEIDHALQ